MEVDDSWPVQAADLSQRREVDVEAFPVIVRPEVGQPGIGGRPGVQCLGLQRALWGHRRHEGADLLDLRAEARLSKVVEVHEGRGSVGHGDLCYSEFRNDDRAWPPPR